MIIILNGDSFSVDGLEILQENFKEIKKKRKNNFIHEKIIFNRYNKSFTIHNEYLKTLQENTNYKMYQVGQYQSFSNALTLKYTKQIKEG